MSYATVTTEEGEVNFANLHGEHILDSENNQKLTVSYAGYLPKRFSISPADVFAQVRLDPSPKPSAISFRQTNPAEEIIQRAIESKGVNDPELKLSSFRHKSYNKLIIDRDPFPPGSLKVRNPEEDETGREFLAENVSVQSFNALQGGKKIVEGSSTAGFNAPTYELLGMDLELPSLYNKEYTVFQTTYAGPLEEKPFKNYSYRILDTVSKYSRPAYVISIKPNRPKAVAGVEGILLIDTVSYAIQYAKLGTSGAIEMEAVHEYSYFEEDDLWFPERQQLLLKPGTGGEDISIFGGSIAVGTVQKKFSALDILLAPGDIEENLYLSSTTTNFDIEFETSVHIPRYSPMTSATNEAGDRPMEFWDSNRQETFTQRDEFTDQQLRRRISNENIERKIELKNAVSNGFFPVGPWNFDLSRFINYNNYEGIRLGLGGETNSSFSENFLLSGYGVYGFKDRRYKYGLGAGVLLNQRSGTWLKLNYRDDIREVASYNYIRGTRIFSLFEPRLVNISYYYAHRDLEVSLEHRITPRLETEVEFLRSDISQLIDYAFFNDGDLYTDYTITEAKMGFLWRPFSKFISTPRSFEVYSQEYPVITGQISKGFSGVWDGDFSFTKIGLRAQYNHERIDKSSTDIIIEGNLGFGELPLTHAFHAFPNNANREGILNRFAVAGKLSFETMYFNEFFSDRQAAIHIRHHLRPFYFSKNYQPQVVLISRHVIGSFRDIEAHRNIEFQTLRHGYSEAGLEINKIFLGFGLSASYRYGAYHLPTFDQNFALKFTFEFQI